MDQRYGFGNILPHLFQGRDGIPLSQTLLYSTLLLLTIALFAYLPSTNDVFAQTTSKKETSQLFKVIVQITNNANVNHIGTVHVEIDGTNQSKVINNAHFPSKKTVSYTFEFRAIDIPVGKGFTAEVVYGDDIFKTTHGLNTPANKPEIAKITLT